MDERRELSKSWLEETKEELLGARHSAPQMARDEILRSLGPLAGDPRLQRRIDQVAILRVSGKDGAATSKLKDKAKSIREWDG